uniref:Uncharacterized protein n=1 Tax=Zea mays TaxID=4577 RepID=A0A804R6F2_MAIZE
MRDGVAAMYQRDGSSIWIRAVVAGAKIAAHTIRRKSANTSTVFVGVLAMVAHIIIGSPVQIDSSTTTVARLPSPWVSSQTVQPSDPFLLWIRKESLKVGDHIYSWKVTSWKRLLALIRQWEVPWDDTLDTVVSYKISQVVDAKVIHLDYNNSRIFLSLKDVKVMLETTLGKEELKETILMCTNRVS